MILNTKGEETGSWGEILTFGSASGGLLSTSDLETELTEQFHKGLASDSGVFCALGYKPF